MSRVRETSFLVIAPLGRDQQLIVRNLGRFGVEGMVFSDVSSALTAMREDNAAGLIVTDEAINDRAAAALQEYIAAQPDWSDLPVLILTSPGSRPANEDATFELQQRFGNVTVIERPVRMETLVTAVRSALRARRRQYELRDNMMRQQQVEDTLRRTERLAVAGTFAASLAHEINNPLASVTNFIFLISEARSLEEARTYAVVADGEVKRIAEIVNQTLQYHRAPMVAANVNIFELIEGTLQLLRGRLYKHNVRIAKKYRHVEAWCVSGEIRQVLANLIGNALDAMKNGGVMTISARYVRNREGQLGVRVSVGDTGSGIPEDVRPLLFQQFFTTKGEQGTGLGLWLSKDLVRRNGGFLQVKSHSGEHSGTVFSFWVPAAEKRQAEGSAQSEGAERSAPSPKSGAFIGS